MTESEDIYAPVPHFRHNVATYLRSYIVPGEEVVRTLYVLNKDITDGDIQFFISNVACDLDYRRFDDYLEITRPRYHYEDKDFCHKHGCGLKTRPHQDPFQAAEGGVEVYCPQCEEQAGEDSIPF